MKSVFKFSKRWLAILLVLPAFLFFTGCDEDDVIVIPVEDGVYIIGSASNFADPSNNAKFSLAINEVDQGLWPTMGEIYIPLKASGSFTIRIVAGDVTQNLGKSATWEIVAPGTHGDQPDVAFQRGLYEADGDPFTVPADGMYHVVIDQQTGVVAIIPVGDWGIIGGATPNGWGGSTPFMSSGFDFDNMTWTGTDIAMTSGDFKFRYSNGWKVEISGDSVKINTNFGGSLAALLPGGDNITMASESMDPGYYSFALSWSAAQGYAMVVTRTGDLPGTDFSAIEMGMVGDGFNDGSAVQSDWDATRFLHTPVSNVSGVFTYEFNNVTLRTDGAFKIRNGNNWDGPYILGYSSITFTGPDAAEIEEASSDDNIQGTVDAAYNLVLSVDGNSLAWTCEVTKL